MARKSILSVFSLNGGGGGGGGGTTDYNDLSNKPKINSTELSGNKTTADLGINYEGMADKPSINGNELTGDKSSSDLGINEFIVVSQLPTTGTTGDVVFVHSDYSQSGTTYKAGLYRHDGTSWVLKIDKTVLVSSITQTIGGGSETSAVTEKALNQYITSGNNGAARQLTSVDLNTIDSTGFYYCASCTNAPTNSGAMIVAKNSNATFVIQLFFNYSTGLGVSYRIKYSASWLSWAPVFLKDTETIKLKDASVESYSGTAENQQEVNKEFSTRFKFLDAKSDVADIVQCYDRGSDTSKTDIVHYNKSTLTLNSIVKVLDDEIHGNVASYYKLTNSTAFTYLASEKPVGVDDVTIDKDTLGYLRVKDGGLTTSKINPNALATTISTTNPVDTKIPTEKAIGDVVNDIYESLGKPYSFIFEYDDDTYTIEKTAQANSSNVNIDVFVFTYDNDTTSYEGLIKGGN